MCVQNFHDSRSLAIRITYRLSLRSSSVWEPRHSSLKVIHVVRRESHANVVLRSTACFFTFQLQFWIGRPQTDSDTFTPTKCWAPIWQESLFSQKWMFLQRCVTDPSAGSPTETLLRLHLPLNDKVWTDSRNLAPMKEPYHNPEASPDHSIGRCDGRCVQRAGT